MTNDDKIEILLVEDNPYDAELTIRSLKKSNLANRIFHVTDGAEALDFLFQRGEFQDRSVTFFPKLVLLDLKLPKISGIEVLKALKSNPSTKMIPVVVLTSSNVESDLISSYNLGVNSYIVKPVDFDKFAEVIKNLGMYWLLLNKNPNNLEALCPQKTI